LDVTGSGGSAVRSTWSSWWSGCDWTWRWRKLAGAELAARGAIAVDRSMRASVSRVWAAGDFAVTHHRLLGETYLPLDTTAHKQGRVAGENAVGGNREYAGSLGSQIVKVFDLVVGRTGLKDAEARNAGFDPVTVAATADDHKAYYAGAEPIAMRWTGDRGSGRLWACRSWAGSAARSPSGSMSPRPRSTVD
jgi:NADPH-dependent 2,4-dienoyl-CoA reductase/sulfur reductase-like enzyme